MFPSAGQGLLGFESVADKRSRVDQAYYDDPSGKVLKEAIYWSDWIPKHNLLFSIFSMATEGIFVMDAGLDETSKDVGLRGPQPRRLRHFRSR